MRKINNIQGLRGIAVLFVVLFHLTKIEEKYGGNITILPDIFNFGMIGVDFFFVISGFIMIYISHDKFQSFENSKNFLYRRFARIYPTYWFYTIIVLIIFIIKPSMVNSSQGNQVDILASFLLYPSNILPMVMVGWTLIHEVYFYCFFFLLFWLTPEKYIVKYLLIWAIIIIVLRLLLDTLFLQSPLINLLTHPLTLEFITGAIFGKFFLIYQNIHFKSIYLMLIGFVIITLSGYSFYVQGYIPPQEWLRVVYLGIPALIILIISVFLENNNVLFPKFLTYIGNASYSIYLSHILTLSALGHLWKYFSNDEIYDNLLVLPIILVGAIVVGIISYNFLEKPLLKFSRKYTL